MAQDETSFDSVYVIESLKPTEYHTGRSLYEGVLVPHREKTPWFDTEYFEAPNLLSFQRALHEVLSRTKKGRLPILHLESHGSRAGMHLADGNVVRWDEMREVLTPINVASRFRLLIVMAMCKGAYLATAMRPPSPAPAWAVIGPEVDVDNLDLEAGCN